MRKYSAEMVDLFFGVQKKKSSLDFKLEKSFQKIRAYFHQLWYINRQKPT